MERGEGRKARGPRGKAEDGWEGVRAERKGHEGKVESEDSEQGRGRDWTRTVAEEEAGHLWVHVHAVEVVFVLQAVVLQSVGDVKGQALAWGAANKHWHHQVALNGRRKASGQGVGVGQRGHPPTPPHHTHCKPASPSPGAIHLYSNNCKHLCTVCKALGDVLSALHIQMHVILKTALHDRDD